MTEPIPKNTINVVMTQLTPEVLNPNCRAIAGVDTLKTVSLRTPKKTRKTIQGRALFASSDFFGGAISDAAAFMNVPYSTLRTSLTSFRIAAFGCAPTAIRGMSFIGMKSRLGMLWMPNAAATSPCSSTFTL